MSELPTDPLLAELAMPTDDGSEVMRLLGRGIPLTLLLDLLDPHGPDSVGILAEEDRGTG
ncbi:MAG TPA: hypothetical protein VFN19_07660 [Candidatus Nanopelagicales bacterium]|nr:hypothetical protein [Candidatus Nanopelagicales bacterium]